MDVDKLLKNNRMRVTGARKAVLNQFIQSGKALSFQELQDYLSSDIDRATIYRTLTTFEDHDLIHKVLDDSGVSKYAICSDDCSGGEHQHEHIHFKCEQCQKTVCLEEVAFSDFQLPEGYQQKEVNILVSGVCKNCS